MKLAVIFAGAILLTACTKNAPATLPSGNSSMLIPLNAGNLWNYADTNIDEDGTRSFTESETMQIFQHVNINNETWFFTNFFNSSGVFTRSVENEFYFRQSATSDSFLFFARTSGSSVVYRDTINASGDKEKYISYSNAYNMNGFDNLIKNVINQYAQSDTTKIRSYMEWYIKPGIGIVEIDSYSSKNVNGGEPFYLQRKATLTSYLLN